MTDLVAVWPSADPTVPGTALVRTGKVTHCCRLHQPGDWFSCCADEDCTPCCHECPNCPGPVLEQGFNAEWRLLGSIAAAHSIAAALERPS
jgi:hypothetical protein